MIGTLRGEMGMAKTVRISSVEFTEFKAFTKLTFKLDHMNILVGPNNCGKSTIINAFRVLDVGIRQARSKKPVLVEGPRDKCYGYPIPAEIVPMSLENVHTDYSEVDTSVIFKLSNGNKLTLYFSRTGGCVLLTDNLVTNLGGISVFKREYPISIQVIPVLGPVEHKESIVTEDTVKRGMITHRASRHFRNYWKYYPDGFMEFAELVKKTWPGMEIQPPEQASSMSLELIMFCLESRMSREIYWSGFGFQIWCQLLTHISRAKNATLLIVDEPEIYLHPDVQRQLLGILRSSGPEVIIATHSAEIMGEADASEIVLVDKTKQTAEHLRDIEGVQTALDSMGSIHNLTLTQLARNRRLLFFEGPDDFKLLRRFAKKLGLSELAAGNDLTIVVSGGFATWAKIKALAWGFKDALRVPIKVGAIFDRDYWSNEEIATICNELSQNLTFSHIHDRKEIENYLLVITVLERVLSKALTDKADITQNDSMVIEPISDVLDRLTSPLKSHLQAQYIDKRTEYLKRNKLDGATITKETIELFESKWDDLETRMGIVPGKEVLRLLRTELQQKYSINLTDYRIVDAFKQDEIPADLVNLLSQINNFRL